MSREYVIWGLPILAGLRLGKAISARHGKKVDFGLRNELEAMAHATIQLTQEKKEEKEKRKLCLKLY